VVLMLKNGKTGEIMVTILDDKDAVVLQNIKNIHILIKDIHNVMRDMPEVNELIDEKFRMASDSISLFSNLFATYIGNKYYSKEFKDDRDSKCKSSSKRKRVSDL
jgi:hypothetical protein